MLKPLGDRVLVEKTEEASEVSQTTTGLYVPTSSKKNKRQTEGTILAVGNACTTLIPGNKIVFDFGEVIEDSGKEYYILREADVLAIVE